MEYHPARRATGDQDNDRSPGSATDHLQDTTFLRAPTTRRDLLGRPEVSFNSELWDDFRTRYSAPIRQHCTRSGLNPAAAEEIVREVFTKLAERLDRRPFNWKSTSFRGWLNQVTNGLIFDHHQSRRSHLLSPQLKAAIREWLPPSIAPDSENDDRERLEAHLWATCLARVRHSANPIHWQIFEMLVVEGLGQRRVAQLFDTTQVNVGVIRHRLVRRIRQEWKSLLKGPLAEDLE